MHYPTRAFHCATLSLLLSASTPVAADSCELNIVRVSQTTPTTALEYDVFNRDGLVKKVEIQVASSQGERTNCAAILKVRPQGPVRLSNAGSNSLHYLLQPLQQTGAFRQGVLTLPHPGQKHRKTLTFAFEAVFQGEQFVASGLYQQTLWLELYRADQGGEQLAERQPFTLHATVKPAARISFFGTQGRAQHLDFGELRDGANISPAPQILIQSTGLFALNISSLYRGALRHHSGQARWDIPYQSMLGQRALALSSPGETLYFDQPTPSLGLRLPLKLTVPKVGKKPAGIYRDMIRVVIFPSELTIN
ncbi:MAG: hypothetical protein ACPG4U_00855 [Pseudomonadales bacterium]